MTRSVLPNLTSIRFQGTSEYLDDLVAQIDAPRLHTLFITFFPQMNFDTPHLVQFISRIPSFEEPNEAHVNLNPDAEVQLIWSSDGYASRLSVDIFWQDFDPWQVDPWVDLEELVPQPSSIAQVYTMCLPPLPTVENLRLRDFTEPLLDSGWGVYIDNGQWLELLRPFAAVKSLYISESFQPNIAHTLQELVGGRTTEVLPSLQNIFLERFEPPFQEAIGQFVSARQLSGHPIAVLPL